MSQRQGRGSRHTRTARRRRWLAAGAAAALLLTAVAVAVRVALTVAVPEPDAGPAAAAACRALQSALPAEVDGQGRRAVRPRSELTAAWGSPPIRLRCGVARPVALQLTSELVVVNDVAWFPAPVEDGYVFTTVRRAAGVEVAVPRSYAPEVNPLTDLAAAITQTLPELPR